MVSATKMDLVCKIQLDDGTVRKYSDFQAIETMEHCSLSDPDVHVAIVELGSEMSGIFAVRLPMGLENLRKMYVELMKASPDIYLMKPRRVYGCLSHCSCGHSQQTEP